MPIMLFSLCQRIPQDEWTRKPEAIFYLWKWRSLIKCCCHSHRLDVFLGGTCLMWKITTDHHSEIHHLGRDQRDQQTSTTICGSTMIYKVDPHESFRDSNHYLIHNELQWFTITITGWWFGTFSIFPYIGNDHANWLSYVSEGLKPPTRSIDYP